MREDYRRLWKLLIDRGMKKSDLQREAGLSASTITKLGRNETVTTETIGKICAALGCTPNDVLSFPGIPTSAQGDNR